MEFKGSSMASPKRYAIALAALAATLVFAALVASSATAAYKTYCNKLVPPKDACNETVVFQRMQENTAQYNGGGNVSVCQKITRGGNNLNRTCGNNYTSSPANNWGEARGHVGNNSDYRHTIDGLAVGQD